MTKAQLLFDPTAECEQFGLLPRGGNGKKVAKLRKTAVRRRSAAR
jgi:hypothetical protein